MKIQIHNYLLALKIRLFKREKSTLQFNTIQLFKLELSSPLVPLIIFFLSNNFDPQLPIT